MGWRKSGVLEHKSGNISETHKDRGRITSEVLQELTNALSNGTTPTPYIPLPQIGVWKVRNPHPKLQSKIARKRVHCTQRNSLYGRPIEFSGIGIRERGHSQLRTARFFFVFPLLSQERVKLQVSNFVRTFIGSIETKAHDFFWKSSWESRKFQGIYVGRIARSSLRQHSCLVICCMYYSCGLSPVFNKRIPVCMYVMYVCVWSRPRYKYCQEQYF